MKSCVWVVLGLCVSSGVAAAKDLPDIRTGGTLRVLMVPVGDRDEFFSSSASGQGMDREIMEGFCNLQHVSLAVVPVKNWDGLIPALNADKGDVIVGRFTVTEARKKLIDFTVEVFPTRNVVFTRKPHKPIETLEELKVERVGTIKGSSMAEALDAAGVPRSAIDDSVPPGGLEAALAKGKVSAAVLGIESAIAARRDDPEIQLGLFLGKPGSLAYGVRHEAPQLLRALNDYIDNVRKSQTWSRLVVKYFGPAAPEILKKARGEGSGS